MATRPTLTARSTPEQVLPFRKEKPFWLDVLLRLVREKPLGLIGLLLILLMVFGAATADVITPHGANELGAGERLTGPSVGNFFGTDNLGRDVFSRVVFGAQVSLFIGLSATLLATVLSLTIGVFSAYAGGIVDMLAQRLVDAFIAFPALVFLLAVIALFADYDIPGLPREGIISSDVIVLIGSLGVLLGVGASRIFRGAALTVKAQPYVEAARVLGAGHLRLIFVHVLPNVMAPAITLATLNLGNIILIEAALSFLGLGVPPNVPTWGGMLNREARSWMVQAPWIAIFPGLALSLAVFGFNMLGDALRDLLDPRLRTGR